MSKYNKQIYNGTPREEVIEIYKFAIKTRKKYGYGQNKISKLIKENFNRDIVNNTVAGWLYLNNIPYNQEKTQFKSKPKPSKKELYNFYIKQKISSERLAKKYKVSTIIVINWLKSYNISVRTHKESMNTDLIKKELSNQKLIRPVKPYKKLSPEKAYVLGVLCGDAHINPKSIRFEIRYDEEFTKEFAKCIKKIYGIKYNYYYYKPRNSYVLYVSSQIISKDLMRYGDFNTYTWVTPKSILNSNDIKIIGNYLKGLFDSEGYVGPNYVSMSSISNGIKDLPSLLNKLKINSKIYKYGKYYSLGIRKQENLKKFQKLVNFIIIRKKEKLNLITK